MLLLAHFPASVFSGERDLGGSGGETEWHIEQSGSDPGTMNPSHSSNVVSWQLQRAVCGMFSN